MAGINEFLEKIISDEKFVEELSMSKDSSEFNKKLKSAGFDIAPKELSDVMKAIKAKQTGALEDEDLDSVSGGLMELAVLPDNWRDIAKSLERFPIVDPGFYIDMDHFIKR